MARVCFLAALICLACLAQSPAARAQYNPQGMDRPSLWAPSLRVGEVGGRVTQVSPQLLTVTPQAPYEGAPTFSMPQRSGRRSVNRQDNQRLAAPVRLGMVPSPSQGGLFREGFLTDFDSQAASGFDLSVSPDTPLYGWPGLNLLPGQQTPLEATRAAGSEYQRFFDLTPSRPAEAPESYSNLVDIAQHRNQDRLQEVYSEAFKLFAEATAERSASGELITEDEKLMRLRQAARLFAAARNLTKASGGYAAADLPILDVLEAHAHLECNRGSSQYVDQALGCLVKAVRDDPKAFYRLAQARRNPGSDGTVAAYFGDYSDGRSVLLERQMLQYVRFASVDAPTTESLILQAYCAWMLDDGGRAARALDEAERTLRERATDKGSDGWSAVIAALRYAL